MDAEFATLVEVEPPWGDYGHILVHGMSAHLPRREGRCLLERTGPYVPDVTRPGLGDVIVTDLVRRQMLAADLSGCSFHPVDKARIVRLEWDSWDRDAELPPMLPESGEPEDFILSRSHDPELARNIGALWEVGAERLPAIDARYLTAGKYCLVAPPDQEPLPDVFKAKAGFATFFSRRAQDAFSADALRWCRFEPATLG